MAVVVQQNVIKICKNSLVQGRSFVIISCSVVEDFCVRDVPSCSQSGNCLSNTVSLKTINIQQHGKTIFVLFFFPQA